MILYLLSAIAATIAAAPALALPHAPARLDPAALASPESLYWPGYMWFWNDRLTEELITAQLNDMAEHGARSAMPIPMPSEFRPTTNITSLEPDYLSPGFFRLYGFTIDHAAKLGMNVWMYDEGGWPSGSACGKVMRANPKLAMRYVERVEQDLDPNQAVEVPSDCLCALLKNGAEEARRLRPGESVRCDTRGGRLETFVIHTGERPDLLDPEATRLFIKLTHEGYRGVAGEHFGKTIRATFTDEPALRRGSRVLPWTPGLDDEFRRRFGYDILDKLPLLFDADGEEAARARIDFHDCWAQRAADSYFGEIQRWCHEHGLMSSGHLGGDSGIEGAVSGGSLLRNLRRMDIPGIDVIWRQIFPGVAGGDPVAGTPIFPKFASSAAHHEGRPWAVTESFCVYGSGLTPAQMKWITDCQYVRGINLSVFGAYNLSTREYYMGGQRPLFGPVNPIWRYLDSFHAYLARLGYLLSLGRPGIETALYLPVRDMWAGEPYAHAAASSCDHLGQALLDSHCDFDLIDDDVISLDSTRVDAGRLIAGSVRYHTVCVPRTRWISDSSLKKLESFARSGGTVLWTDAEGRPAPDWAVKTSAEQIAERVKPLAEVEPVSADIGLCKRVLENGALYFVTNESPVPVHCAMSFHETNRPVVIDPSTGRFHRPLATRTDDGWKMEIDLGFAGSKLVLFVDDNVQAEDEPSMPGETLITIDKDWSCRRMRCYKVTENGFAVEDCAATVVPIALGDWAGALGSDFSGDAQYSVRFDCDKQAAAAARWLDLGDVHCACEVTLNGASLGKRAWPPYSFGISGLLREGSNELKVMVTNTMANQLVSSKVFDRWEPKEVGPYHARALGFERDSLSSGLYGPVSIRR